MRRAGIPFRYSSAIQLRLKIQTAIRLCRAGASTTVLFALPNLETRRYEQLNVQPIQRIQHAIVQLFDAVNQGRQLTGKRYGMDRPH